MQAGAFSMVVFGLPRASTGAAEPNEIVTSGLHVNTAQATYRVPGGEIQLICGTGSALMAACIERAWKANASTVALIFGGSQRQWPPRSSAVRHALLIIKLSVLQLSPDGQTLESTQALLFTQ